MSDSAPNGTAPPPPRAAPPTPSTAAEMGGMAGGIAGGLIGQAIPGATVVEGLRWAAEAAARWLALKERREAQGEAQRERDEVDELLDAAATGGKDAEDAWRRFWFHALTGRGLLKDA